MHYASGMRFGVLGPLEVDSEIGPVALGGQKERLLLAQLLARPDQVVSVEALIRGLWGQRPPPSANKTRSHTWSGCGVAWSPAAHAVPPVRY